MATGSSSETLDRASNRRNRGSRHGFEPSNNNDDDNIPPFVPTVVRDRDPRDLRSWAKRTGFVSIFSGETGTDSSSRSFRNARGGGPDLEKGVDERESSLSPKIEIDPILGRTKAETSAEIEEPSSNGFQQSKNNGGLGLRNGNGNRDEERLLGFNGNATVLGSRDEERVGFNGNANGSGDGVSEGNVAADPKKEEPNGLNEECYNGSFYQEPILGGNSGPFEVKCGVLDNPGFAPVTYYGVQHYLSLIGSLVLIPLVTVPLMGGSDKDRKSVV